MASQVGKTQRKADSGARHEQKIITHGRVHAENAAGRKKRNMRSPNHFLPAEKLQPDEAQDMKIKVHYLGLVKTYTNKTQDDVTLAENAKLSDLLNKMATEFGKQFKTDIYEPGDKDLKTMFTVMVNGVVSGQLGGLDTMLKEGDNVILMPLMTGG